MTTWCIVVARTHEHTIIVVYPPSVLHYVWHNYMMCVQMRCMRGTRVHAHTCMYMCTHMYTHPLVASACVCRPAGR